MSMFANSISSRTVLRGISVCGTSLIIMAGYHIMTGDITIKEVELLADRGAGYVQQVMLAQPRVQYLYQTFREIIITAVVLIAIRHDPQTAVYTVYFVAFVILSAIIVILHLLSYIHTVAVGFAGIIAQFVIILARALANGMQLLASLH
ncbi:hypothetical protein KCU78_g1276, partial [Aureobasidium melanogenum]